MNEQVYQFGPGRSLVGVLTEPAASQQKKDQPAMLLLNSGLIHRVGPNRIYVSVARELAQAGFTVLRFDFSGIGDSPPREDDRSFEERSVSETRAAMDLMAEIFAIDKFILSGICSGADIAFLTAQEDTRVRGIIPIDFYSLPSTGYLIHSYKKRLVSLRSWGNLLRGKSDILKFLQKGLKRLTVLKTARASGHSGETSIGQIEQEFLKGFDILAYRKTGVHLIYSAGSPAYFNYRQLFAAALEPHIKCGQVSTNYLDTADHGFTLLFHQAQLIECIKSGVAILTGVTIEKPAY